MAVFLLFGHATLYQKSDISIEKRKSRGGSCLHYAGRDGSGESDESDSELEDHGEDAVDRNVLGPKT